MHPAYSVIIFTTASGAGYGLMFWVSLAHVAGALPGGRWAAFAAMTIALVLITGGLLSSTLHLGHPERAVHAFSQWRTSWLSREGVVAVATYGPAGLLWLLWLLDIDSGFETVLALLSAIGAVATVYCTGMIYASLRTVRHWYRSDVPYVYLALAAATGAVLLGLVVAMFGQMSVWLVGVAITSLGVSAALKLRYWSGVDADPGQYTAEMAIGLGHMGKVRPLDPPHTMPNFVMREMGYSVARKHTEKLRLIALLALFVAPVLLLLVAFAAGWSALMFLLASVAAAVGVLVERWLFFAQAEHVSQLYYGKDRA